MEGGDEQAGKLLTPRGTDLLENLIVVCPIKKMLILELRYLFLYEYIEYAVSNSMPTPAIKGAIL